MDGGLEIRWVNLPMGALQVRLVGTNHSHVTAPNVGDVGKRLLLDWMAHCEICKELGYQL